MITLRAAGMDRRLKTRQGRCSLRPVAIQWDTSPSGRYNTVFWIGTAYVELLRQKIRPLRTRARCLGIRKCRERPIQAEEGRSRLLTPATASQCSGSPILTLGQCWQRRKLRQRQSCYWASLPSARAAVGRGQSRAPLLALVAPFQAGRRQAHRSSTGLSGLYPVYAQAYRAAARSYAFSRDNCNPPYAWYVATPSSQPEIKVVFRTFVNRLLDRAVFSL